jgi:hypothetical protein
MHRPPLTSKRSAQRRSAAAGRCPPPPARPAQDDAFKDIMAAGGAADDGAALLDERRHGSVSVWDPEAGRWASASRGVRLLQEHHKLHWRLKVGRGRSVLPSSGFGNVNASLLFRMWHNQLLRELSARLPPFLPAGRELRPGGVRGGGWRGRHGAHGRDDGAGGGACCLVRCTRYSVGLGPVACAHLLRAIGIGRRRLRSHLNRQVLLPGSRVGG